MKNILIILIKIIPVSFLLSISLLRAAANPSWNILELHKTKIYLGLISKNNILDMDAKKVPLIFGYNEQQYLSRGYGYAFSIGNITRYDYSLKTIYLKEDTILERWSHPIMHIVEPHIVSQDSYNPSSLVYIVDRLKPRIGPMPIRFEYHNSFAQSEAKKDLKKCYEYLFLYNKHEKNRTIGLLPLKTNIDTNALIAIAVESLNAFITDHKDSYDSIYVLLNNYHEYRIYVSLLNRCINNSRY